MIPRPAGRGPAEANSNSLRRPMLSCRLPETGIRYALLTSQCAYFLAKDDDFIP